MRRKSRSRLKILSFVRCYWYVESPIHFPVVQYSPSRSRSAKEAESRSVATSITSNCLRLPHGIHMPYRHATPAGIAVRPSIQIGGAVRSFSLFISSIGFALSMHYRDVDDLTI